MNINQYRARRANRITAVIATACAIGCGSALVPAVEHTVTAALILLAVLGFTASMARLAARWVRERREDRADAMTAALWRAEHAPHLLTPIPPEVARPAPHVRAGAVA